MLAREWVIAALYRQPSDYGIPELPAWVSRRDANGRFVLTSDPDGEPFISAGDPMRVRR